MVHPFGDLLSQYLHRKRGLSQSKLAAGILQEPAIITKMCKGERLNGPQARERVLAIIDWLHEMDVLRNAQEADALLVAAAMAPLRNTLPNESRLLERLHTATHSALVQVEHASFVPKLPTATTSLIGRENDLRILRQHIMDERCRILTLVGPGGAGKTRLAIEAAHISRTEFANGACFVDLQPVTHVDALPFAIATALGVALSTSGNPVEQLESHLSNKQLLLILDNFEHLLAGATVLSELVSSGTGIKLLVTSRALAVCCIANPGGCSGRCGRAWQTRQCLGSSGAM